MCLRSPNAAAGGWLWPYGESLRHEPMPQPTGPSLTKQAAKWCSDSVVWT